MTILFITILALAQFSFQTALMGHYSQDELASFIGIFNGVISITCIIIQATLARRLLSWIGLLGVLLILPIACILVGLGLSLWPVFGLFIFFNATQLLLSDAFMFPCREIMLNPYPTALRKKANMSIRGYATPIGGLIGALMVFIIQRSSLHLLGVIVVFIAVLLIYFTIKAVKGYQTTLYDSLKENRYAIHFLDLTAESAVFMREHVLSNMKSNNINAIHTALSFFEQEHFVANVADPEIQSALIQLLAHPQADIRYNAVRAINNMKAQSAIPVLLHHLKQEQNPEVGSEIIDTLCALNSHASLEQAMEYKNNVNPFLNAYGIILLDNMNEIHAKKIAIQEIERLMQGPVFERLLLAKMERHLTEGALHHGRLLALLQDPVNEVSVQALRSLNEEAVLSFIPILLEYLNHPQRAYFAAKALTMHHEAILEHLLQVHPSVPLRQRNIMLRLLASSTQNAALSKLIALSKTDSVVLRFTIAHLIERYSPNKEQFKQERIEFLQYIADEISALLRLQKTDNSGLNQEIRLHLRLNRAVFLSWFSTLSQRGTVARIRKYIEKPELYDSNDVAKAYELLDSISNTPKLRDLITQISQDYKKDKTVEESIGINSSILMLANHPFIYHEGTMMNTFDKISLLRQVPLFADIPVESLHALAEVALEKDMAEGEIIFNNGDETDGFYCIVAGEIAIRRDTIELSRLKSTDYFGELGAFDHSPRTADAIAIRSGLLLYIDKDEFIRVLDDFPEMMRSIVAQIINYLRSNLNNLLPMKNDKSL